MLKHQKPLSIKSGQPQVDWDVENPGKSNQIKVLKGGSEVQNSECGVQSYGRSEARCSFCGETHWLARHRTGLCREISVRRGMAGRKGQNDAFPTTRMRMI